MSPKLEFRGTGASATPIDTSETSPNAFVGVFFRPRINDKWTFIARADVGGGDADLTWSGLIGLEYRVTSWGGLEFGYKGLGIDVKGDGILSEYRMTHYGPIVGFRFQWTR